MEEIAVLLISENKEKSSIVREALAAMNIHKIKIVYGYEEALTLLKYKIATVLIVEMGIKHQNIDALSFITTLRKNLNDYAHVQDAPIVLLASEARKADVEEARDSGATEFMVYPFSTNRLKTVLKSVIEHPRKFIVSESFFGPDRRRKQDFPPGGIERRRRPNQSDSQKYE